MKITNWVLSALLLSAAPVLAQDQGDKDSQGLSAPEKSSFRDTLRNKGRGEQGKTDMAKAEEELEQVRFDEMEALKQSVEELKGRLDQVEMELKELKQAPDKMQTTPQQPGIDQGTEQPGTGEGTEDEDKSDQPTTPDDAPPSTPEPPK